MKKILLTGANGFIGKNIIEKISDTYEIVKITRDGPYNILDLNSLMQINDIDIVLHTAAKTFIPDSFSDPYSFYEFNIQSTLNIAEYCRVKKVPKLIYFNSYTYGHPEYLPIDESHRVAFHSPYNKSKYLAEELLLNYLENITRVTSLRLFNLYGKYQGDTFLIPQIIKDIHNKKSIHVKDLIPKRDYLYIKDLLLLIEIIISSDTANGIYNIGSGKSYSVQEVINEIKSTTNTDAQIISENSRREGEILDCVADIKKIKIDTGWFPKYDLKSGLLDYIEEGVKRV